MAAIASAVQFSNALAQSCYCLIDILFKVKYDNKKYGILGLSNRQSHSTMYQN